MLPHGFGWVSKLGGALVKWSLLVTWSCALWLRRGDLLLYCSMGRPSFLGTTFCGSHPLLADTWSTLTGDKHTQSTTLVGSIYRLAMICHLRWLKLQNLIFQKSPKLACQVLKHPEILQGLLVRAARMHRPSRGAWVEGLETGQPFARNLCFFHERSLGILL